MALSMQRSGTHRLLSRAMPPRSCCWCPPGQIRETLSSLHTHSPLPRCHCVLIALRLWPRRGIISSSELFASCAHAMNPVASLRGRVSAARPPQGADVRRGHRSQEGPGAGATPGLATHSVDTYSSNFQYVAAFCMALLACWADTTEEMGFRALCIPHSAVHCSAFSTYRLTARRTTGSCWADHSGHSL